RGTCAHGNGSIPIPPLPGLRGLDRFARGRHRVRVFGIVVELLRMLRAQGKDESLDGAFRHRGLAAELLALVIERRETGRALLQSHDGYHSRPIRHSIPRTREVSMATETRYFLLYKGKPKLARVHVGYARAEVFRVSAW